MVKNIKGFQKGYTPWNKGLPKEKQPQFGKKISDEAKRKMRESKIKAGIKPPSRLGIKDTIETKKRKSDSGKKAINSGRFLKGHTPWTKGKKFPQFSGENHPNWVGDKIKYLDKRIRKSVQYVQWRSDCFQRDNWTCQTCGTRGGKLIVHHIKEFNKILKENNIKTFEQALNCKELWDINNGVSLCENCHKLTQSYKKHYGRNKK